jgi:hypothetical protein
LNLGLRQGDFMVEEPNFPRAPHLVRELMSDRHPKRAWTNMVAAYLTIFFMLVAPHGVASAQPQSPHWDTFVGWKFGTTIACPASDFSALPEPDAHDGRTFVSPDGAQIAVFASYNVLDDAIDTSWLRSSKMRAMRG